MAKNNEDFLSYVGIDIGGTLGKICFALQKNSPVKFQHIQRLKKNEFNKQIQQLHITGGGAYRFIELFNKELEGIEIVQLSEFESLSKGFHMISLLQPNESIFTMKNCEIETYVLQPNKVFPFLLVNIGSGVSILKFESIEQYERIGGTSLGGGLFLGLSHLITGNKDFDELLDISQQGDNQNTDKYISDIYHDSSSPEVQIEEKQIDDDILCVSLGRVRNELENKREIRQKICVNPRIKVIGPYFESVEDGSIQSITDCLSQRQITQNIEVKDQQIPNTQIIFSLQKQRHFFRLFYKKSPGNLPDHNISFFDFVQRWTQQRGRSFDSESKIIFIFFVSQPNQLSSLISSNTMALLAQWVHSSNLTN